MEEKKDILELMKEDVTDHEPITPDAPAKEVVPAPVAPVTVKAPDVSEVTADLQADAKPALPKPKATWVPQNLLAVKLLNNEYAPKWVSKHNITKRLSEGWTLVKYTEIKDPPDRTILDGGKLDSTVKIRELTLMKLHKDKLEARKEYYRKMSSDQLKASVGEFEQKAQDGTHTGAGKKGAYGGVKVEIGGLKK